MSIHINAQKGDIAETVLLPGDPLRAKHIAENFLEDATCYNTVRNMLGYTGTYKGKRVSVQGTGMGVPSAILYAQELIQEFGAKKLIRVGTCGAMQEHIQVRDVIVAQSAATDSSLIYKEFAPIHFPPIGNYELIEKTVHAAREHGTKVHVGNVFTSDSFYTEDTAGNEKLQRYGVLAVEMETAGLYYLGSKFGVQTLSVLTVSDHVLTGEETTSEERQTSFNEMIEIALDAALS